MGVLVFKQSTTVK